MINAVPLENCRRADDIRVKHFYTFGVRHGCRPRGLSYLFGNRERGSALDCEWERRLGDAHFRNCGRNFLLRHSARSEAKMRNDR